VQGHLGRRPPLELDVGNQPLVRVPVGFDAAKLARLLELLEERL
jgi:hypothetical protein